MNKKKWLSVIKFVFIFVVIGCKNDTQDIIDYEINAYFTRTNDLANITEKDLTQLIYTESDDVFLESFEELLNIKTSFKSIAQLESVSDDIFFIYSSQLYSRLYKIFIHNKKVRDTIIHLFTEFIAERNVFVISRLISIEYEFLYALIKMTGYYKVASKKLLRELSNVLPSVKECLLGYYVTQNLLKASLDNKKFYHLYISINDTNYKALLRNNIFSDELDYLFLIRNIEYYCKLDKLLKDIINNGNSIYEF